MDTEPHQLSVWNSVHLFFNLNTVNCDVLRNFLPPSVQHSHSYTCLAGWSKCMQPCPQNLPLSLIFKPYNFSGNTSGLLGFWDGDQDKEFLLPNGQFLETNSSHSRIHYDFGQLCKFSKTIHVLIVFSLLICERYESEKKKMTLKRS